MEWLIAIVVFIAIIIYVQKQLEKARRSNLMDKYNDEELVNLIMSKSFWQGQTEEQLTDSLGHPLDIDQKVMKTKTKETWKYNETGKNRYALKVILENGEVVGWDQK